MTFGTKKFKKKLWPIISEYIRRRDADENGNATCCTCGIVRPWRELQAGHFIPSAQGNSTRWDERNIHAQCMRCNMALGGNGAEYYPYMIRRYGHDVVDELRRLSSTTRKMSKQDWIDLRDDYQDKLNKIS